MSYSIELLAPGSYDVLRNGSLVAGLVREVDSSDTTRGWVVELLDEMPPGDLPTPFTSQRHAFGSLTQAMSWLGIGEDGDGANHQSSEQGAT